jgi:hypothetical protein
MSWTRILLSAAITLVVLCAVTRAQTPRPQRRDTILRNRLPTAVLSASVTTITLPCESSRISLSGACPANVSTSVQLTTTASDPEGDALSYSVIPLDSFRPVRSARRNRL